MTQLVPGAAVCDRWGCTVDTFLVAVTVCRWHQSAATAASVVRQMASLSASAPVASSSQAWQCHGSAQYAEIYADCEESDSARE